MEGQEAGVTNDIKILAELGMVNRKTDLGEREMLEGDDNILNTTKFL